MNHASRRLAAAVLALGLAGTLSACGQDNPFGRIVRGEDPNATPTPASTTEMNEPTGFGLPTGDDTMTQSPDTSTGTVLADPASPTTSGPEATTTSPTDGAPTSSVPGTQTATVTSSPSHQTTTVEIDGMTVRDVPSGLGFPPQAQVGSATSLKGGGVSVVMSAPAESEIFSFYRSTLPAGGFRVVSDTSGTLTFTGHGYRGSLIGIGEGAVLTWTRADS